MEVSKVIEPYLSRAEEHGKMITLAIAIPTLIIIGILFAGAALFERYNREKLQAVRNLHYLAHHDTMTGALNRNSFLHELEEAFAAEGGRRFVALHYIDLDRFKEINDKLGHNVGDELICSAAGRLQALAGDGDLVCRLGGDEFALAQTQVRAAVRRRNAMADSELSGNGHAIPARTQFTVDLRERWNGICGYRQFVAERDTRERRHRALPGKACGASPLRTVFAVHAGRTELEAQTERRLREGDRCRRIRSVLPAAGRPGLAACRLRGAAAAARRRGWLHSAG